MDEKTVFRIVFFFAVVMFGTGITIGIFFGSGHKNRADELALTVDRLTQQISDATERAGRIERELVEARNELDTIRARIGVAQGIADELTSGAVNALESVDRIIRKMELLESALSVILDW
jgi:chromosome segregation ATPase